MRMIEYVAEIKRQLRDTHHYQPSRIIGGELIFDSFPDGEYPMVIEGKLDRVLVVNGAFQCCRFNAPRPEGSEGKRYESWCTDEDGKPMRLGWSKTLTGAERFAKSVEEWPGKSNWRVIDIEPATA